MSKPPHFKGQATAEHLGWGFMRIAKQFREVQDYAPDQFVQIAALMGVSLRTAYYFAKIDRAFSSLNVDEGRLLVIGWTKLKIIADHINSSNSEQLLDLAETSTVRELKILVDEGVPADGTRCVLLYLEPLEYALFEKAVLSCGATKAGKGLVDKEAALAKALAKSLEA